MKNEKNKILGRVAACVAAGVLVLSSCTACGVNIYSTMDDKIDLVIEGEKNIAQISSIVGSPVASLTSKDNVLVVRYKNGASYTSGIKRDGCKLILQIRLQIQAMSFQISKLRTSSVTH